MEAGRRRQVADKNEAAGGLDTLCDVIDE